MEEEVEIHGIGLVLRFGFVYSRLWTQPREALFCHHKTFAYPISTRRWF